MCELVYLCKYCKKGHKSKKELELCRIAALEEPTTDEILMYASLKQELEMKKVITKVRCTRPKV